ncbi:MAG: cysteine desulfurase [Clostridiales Family XIII bacterium]|nr:cysteine desulfurase [Clostridiales Family XIII bacterium]
MKIYLDNGATTRVIPEVAKAVYLAMTETYANPSALHTAGQEAERIMKQGRQQIAFSLNTKQPNIIFTGSGTEADNLALLTSFRNPTPENGQKLLISSVEHPAVKEPAAFLASKGVELTEIPVLPKGKNALGMIDLAAFEKLLGDNIGLISVMHVNNEIGTIQPIEELTRIVSKYMNARGIAIPIHVDAVQSFGKFQIDVTNGDFRRVDFVSMSAHKLHGPKGIGALYARNFRKVQPMIFGGGQEGGKRSGTENVPGIVGFGLATRTAISDIVAHAAAAATARKRLLDRILSEIPEVQINSPLEHSTTGKPGHCSPYVLNVSFLDTRGEVIVHELERSGIYASTGSACANLSKSARGGTLGAIGLTQAEAEGAIRFSFSRFNTVDEMDFVAEKLAFAVARFRNVGRK